MRARDVCWSLVFFAGCSFHADCGGNNDLHTGEIAEQLKQAAPEGTTFTKVTCPDNIKAKVDVTFNCQIEVDGRKTYPIHVTITKVEGSRADYKSSWERPMVTEAYVRTQFGEQIQQEFAVPVAIDCGEPLREVPADGVVRCDATIGAVKTQLVVTFDSNLDEKSIELADPVYSTIAAERDLVPRVREKLGPDAVVDCGPPAAVVRPADGVVTCNVTQGAEKHIVRVELDEKLEVVSWTLQPS